MTPGAIRSLLRSALAFALTLACRSATPPAAGTPVTVPPVPASTPNAPERELSVVWLLVDGNPRSFFLDSNAGKLDVRGEQPGAWFVSKNGVYRFKPTSALRASTDCSTYFEPQEPPAEDAPPPPEDLDLEVNGAVAERLDGPGEIEIVGLPQLENAGTFSNGVSLVASAGKHLFIASHSDEYYCGAAHGFRTRGIDCFDLERREFHPLLDRKALKRFQRDEISRNREPFLECASPYAEQIGAGTEAEELLDNLSIAAMIPRFTPKEGFYLELGWALSVAYAFGTEAWGSYTSGCPETQAAVSDLFSIEAPPRALGDLLALHPQATAGGWSRLTNTSDDFIATVSAAFERPAPEP